MLLIITASKCLVHKKVDRILIKSRLLDSSWCCNSYHLCFSQPKLLLLSYEYFLTVYKYENNYGIE